MEIAESKLLANRLMSDIAEMKSCESPIMAANWICAQWYARADLACMLSRRSISDACYRAAELVNAAAAYRRGVTWIASV